MYLFFYWKDNVYFQLFSITQYFIRYFKLSLKYLPWNTFEMSSTLTESYCSFLDTRNLLKLSLSQRWDADLCSFSLSLLRGVRNDRQATLKEERATVGLDGCCLLPCLSHWNRTLLSPPPWSSDWRGEECNDGGWGGCCRHCHPRLNRPQLRGWGRGWGSRSGSGPFWLSFFGPPCQPGVYQKWQQHV